MRLLVVALSGLLFGGGLALSGMTNPAKVVGFLDLFGQWDPSLMFVMGGALAVTIPLFFMSKKAQITWFGDSLEWPSLTQIDRPLISGAVLFGIGWGIYGLCPGPAVASLWTMNAELISFVIAMVAGLSVAHFFKK